MGIPVIAFCDSDSPLRYVDIAIPANNKGRYSIGLLYWLLSREVLRLRGTLAREERWDVAVDLFFYREPEELKALEEGAKESAAAEGNTYEETPAYEEGAAGTFEAPAAGFGGAEGGWDAGAAEGGQWSAGAAGGQWTGAPAYNA